jgi:ylmG protein
MLAYILTSWVPQIKNNFIVEFLEAICEPYLKLFRKFIPPIGMLDISPVVALIVLSVIQNLIIALLFKTV